MKALIKETKEIVPGGKEVLGEPTYNGRRPVHAPAHCGRRMRSALLVLGLIIGSSLIAPGRAAAQSGIMVNRDGAFPASGLVLISNTLYGTAQAGGDSARGTVFAVNTDGTGFTGLRSLTDADGMIPYGELACSSNTLYGTATCGGSTGAGTIFKLKTDGSGFTTVHNFTAPSGSFLTNSDGAEPYAGLTIRRNTLYGTAEEGGSAGQGSVFSVNTDGTSFVNLHSFTATSPNASGVITNSDGAAPQSGLVLSSGTLYGTAFVGGSAGAGTVFALSTSCSSFAVLHSFTASSTNSSGIYTNGDGANPHAGMVLSGCTLYGTAQNGGSSGNGTIFSVHTDGSGFRVLHSFTDLGNHTNSDGAVPHAALVLSGCTLYGVAQYGGSSGNGTVFAVNTDGSCFRTLHNFTILNYPGRFPGTNSDGTYPYGTLVLSCNTLYGTALFGGNAGNGTVFAVNTDGSGFTTLHSFTKLVRSLPQLTIARSGGSVVLRWPLAVPGTTIFTLQSSSDPADPGGWWYLPFTSYVENGQNVVNVPVWDDRQYYRLVPQSEPGGDCAKNGDCTAGSLCIYGTCMIIYGGGGLGGGGLGGGLGGGIGGCPGCGTGICNGCGG